MQQESQPKPTAPTHHMGAALVTAQVRVYIGYRNFQSECMPRPWDDMKKKSSEILG